MRTVRLLCGLTIALAVFLVLSGCGGAGPGPGDAKSAPASANGGPDLVRRIVVFEKDYTNQAAQEALVRRFGADDLKELD